MPIVFVFRDAHTAAMTHQQPRLELRRDVERPHWRIRAFVETPAGLRRRNFIVGYKDEISLKEARRRRLELLAKINHGDLRDSGGMTFRDLMARFDELRMPSLKASTQGFYRSTSSTTYCRSSAITAWNV